VIGKEYRNLSLIEFPEFIAPLHGTKFTRGGEECTCICKAKYLPRNAILIRPNKISDSVKIYGDFEESWKKGELQRIAVGSCQQFIQLSRFKPEFRKMLENTSVSCIDNMDGSQLKKGDILITRHGRKTTTGKPYLIVGEK